MSCKSFLASLRLLVAPRESFLTRLGPVGKTGARAEKARAAVDLSQRMYDNRLAIHLRQQARIATRGVLLTCHPDADLTQFRHSVERHFFAYAVMLLDTCREDDRRGRWCRPIRTGSNRHAILGPLVVEREGVERWRFASILRCLAPMRWHRGAESAREFCARTRLDESVETTSVLAHVPIVTAAELRAGQRRGHAFPTLRVARERWRPHPVAGAPRSRSLPIPQRAHR